jgi:hypothetical protein
MKKWIIMGGVGIFALALILSFGRSSGGSGQISDEVPRASVQRGDLVIDVLEGGNIQALNFLEYRNEVTDQSGIKILEIIDEGYYVTEEDVANKKVLVRLDQSKLEEQIVDHDVEFQQTEAAFAEAKQNIEISQSEALSQIKSARQLMRFALLDFQKFVGATAAKQTLRTLNLPYDSESLDRYEDEATALIVNAFDTEKLKVALAKAEDDSDPFGKVDLTGNDSLASSVNFSTFLEQELLGDGEAEQTIRRMRDEALVAASQLAVVAESVQGAKRLHEKEFITRQTLDNEIVGLDKAKIALQRSETELDLFRDYEFPKEAEKMLSNYEESLLSLIRIKREEAAKMTQVFAKFRSAKRRYDLELRKRENLDIQLASCVITAQQSGLVAYGGAKDNYYTSRFYDGISSGATLKTGQPIISIPDMSRLGVEVSIHESHIKKIELGQKVYITAESEPGRTLQGHVTKVAVLPDSNASRYNPSLKVYPSAIEIEGTHEFLKPGMSAKAEIIVDELENVLYVPIQAVFVENDEHFVFLIKGNSYVRQVVRIGANNNNFIEIQSGLDEGAAVLLKTPDDYESAKAHLSSPNGPRRVESGSETAGESKSAKKSKSSDT